MSFHLILHALHVSNHRLLQFLQLRLVVLLDVLLIIPERLNFLPLRSQLEFTNRKDLSEKFTVTGSRFIGSDSRISASCMITDLPTPVSPA